MHMKKKKPSTNLHLPQGKTCRKDDGVAVYIGQDLYPDFRLKSGQKGCQQAAKPLRLFYPGLRLQQDKRSLKNRDKKTPYPLAGFGTIWTNHLSRLQIKLGKKG
jgi:hypothetical protein